MSFASAGNPFPGLRPFEFEDRKFFFGRDRQVRDLYRKLLANRFVAVVGASGSGKSSVVKAGLSGRLSDLEIEGAGGHWHVISLRPLGRPLCQLAEALVDARQANSDAAAGPVEDRQQKHATAVSRAEARLTRSSDELTALLDEFKLAKGDHLVIIVDQFEELFRYPHMDENVSFDERALFVKHLLAVAQAHERPYHVLITMRSEFIGECPSFQGLAEAINDSQFLTPRLTREQRREAILGPIELASGEIQPALLQRLLNDVGHEPDQLPVMQHALMRSWRAARPHQSLDLQHYESIGCMAAAISDHANAVYGRLKGPGEKHTAERLFKALTDVDRDGRAIRRPQRVNQLMEVIGGDEADLRTVLRAFRDAESAFLVPGSGTPINSNSVIDISHEALIRKWDRLQEWVQQEAHDGRVYRRLYDMTREYKQDATALLGTREARDRTSWWQEVAPTAAWAERYGKGGGDVAFADVAQLVKKSVAAARHAQRKRTAVLGGVMLVLALATGVSAYFGYQASLSEQRAIAATKQEVTAKKQAIADAQRATKAEGVAEEKADIASKALLSAETARKTAEKEKTRADRQRQVADRALRNDYRSRIGLATKLLKEGDAVTAALLATESLPDKRAKDELVRSRPFVPEALGALQEALSAQLERKILHGHEERVRSAVYSADGRLILTASDDGTARLWDARSNKELMVYKGHTELLWSAVFSPDAARVLTASGDGTARLWDTKTGKEIAVFRGHVGTIYSAQLSPDGTRVVTAGEDNLVKLWDAATARELRTFTGHDEAVISAAFSADGSRVVTASVDKTIGIWETDTGKMVRVLEGHNGAVVSAVFSADGGRILSASLDRTARIWNAKTRKELKRLTGHNGGVWTAVFSPGDSAILTGSDDGTARIWNAETGKQVQVFKVQKAEVFSAAYASDGSKVLTALSDGTVRVWSIEPAASKVLLGHKDYVRSVAMTRNGDLVLTTSDDNTARIWNASRRELVRELRGHQGDVLSGTFSADGKLVLTASSDGTVRLWDTGTGKPHDVQIRHEEPVNSAVFSPDKTQILTASDDGHATIWDIKSQKALHLFRHQVRVLHAVFSANGRQVLTAAADGTARIWDISSGKVKRRITGHGNAVHQAIFSVDGNKVLTASDDGTAKLWEVATGRRLQTFTGHEGRVYSIAWSPDGKRILTASADGTARLWDPETGNTLGVVARHTDYIRFAMFSPDAKHILTASDDATARIWRYFATTQELVEHAKSSLLRCLTPEQRSGFYLPPGLPPFCRSKDKWPYSNPQFHIGEGEARLKDGNDTEARTNFDTALQLDNSLAARIAAAYVARGRNRLLANQDNLAAAYFGEAARRNPKEAPKYNDVFALAYIERAKQHIKVGKEEKAANDIDKAAKQRPDKLDSHMAAIAGAYLDRAVTLLGSGDDPGSKTSLAKAIKRHHAGAADYKSAFADALMERVITRIAKSKDEEAIADFAEALRINSAREAEYAEHLANAFIERAKQQISENKDDAAQADFAMAVRRNSAGKTDYEEQIAGAYIARARGHLSAQKDVKARSDFEAALVLHAGANKSVAEAYRNFGWRQRNQGKLKKALHYFERARHYYPDDIDALIGKATAKYDLEQYAAARADIDEVIQRKPENSLAHRVRGWIAMATGNFPAARDDFSNAIRLEAKDSYLYIERAASHRMLKNFIAAAADETKAKELGARDLASRLIGLVHQPLLRLIRKKKYDDAAVIGFKTFLETIKRFQIPENGQSDVKTSTVILAYAVSGVFFENATYTQLGPATPCDRLAAYPEDPLRRVRDGVQFSNIPASKAFDACDAAIKSHGRLPRLLLQRARTFSKLAEEASAKSKAKEHYKSMIDDLDEAMNKSYIYAFNNMAYALSNGQGVDKSQTKAADLYLNTFNRTVQCCGAGAARHLMKVETKYGRDTVWPIVSALLDWGAALGDPAAHETLAEFYAAGLLTRDKKTSALKRDIFRHLLLAARLYRERAKTKIPRPAWDSPQTDLNKAEALAARIAKLSAQFPSDETAAIKTEAAAFKRKRFEALPPWIAPGSPEQRTEAR